MQGVVTTYKVLPFLVKHVYNFAIDYINNGRKRHYIFMQPCHKTCMYTLLHSAPEMEKC